MIDTSIDPYHRLLGIPRSEQPPTAQRLLGLNRDEQNEGVIRAAMEQRLAFLRTLQQGALAEASQRLANEVSRAGLELINRNVTALSPGIIPAQDGFQESKSVEPKSDASKPRTLVAADQASSMHDDDLAWKDDGDSSRDSDRALLEPHAESDVDQVNSLGEEAPEESADWVQRVMSVIPENHRKRLEPHAVLVAPVLVGLVIGLMTMVPLFAIVVASVWWNFDSAATVADASTAPLEGDAESREDATPVNAPGVSQSTNSQSTNSQAPDSQTADPVSNVAANNTADGNTADGNTADGNTADTNTADSVSTTSDPTASPSGDGNEDASLAMIDTPPGESASPLDGDSNSVPMDPAEEDSNSNAIDPLAGISAAEPDESNAEPSLPEPKVAIDYIELLQRRSDLGISLSDLSDSSLRPVEIQRLRAEVAKTDLPELDQAALWLELQRAAVFERDLSGLAQARKELAALSVEWPEQFDRLSNELTDLQESLALTQGLPAYAKTQWMIDSLVGQLLEADRLETAIELCSAWESSIKAQEAPEFRSRALARRRTVESFLEQRPAEIVSEPWLAPTGSDSDEPVDPVAQARWSVVAQGDAWAAVEWLQLDLVEAETDLFGETQDSAMNSPAASTESRDSGELESGNSMSSGDEPAEEESLQADAPINSESTAEPLPDEPGTELPGEASDVGETLIDSETNDSETIDAIPEGSAAESQPVVGDYELHVLANALWLASERLDRKEREWLRPAAGAIHAAADPSLIPKERWREIQDRIDQAYKAGAWSDRAGRLAPFTALSIETWTAEPSSWKLALEVDPTCLKLSPDRHWLAIGNLRGSVDVYDSLTGNLIKSWEGHDRAVSALEWFPDNSKLCTASLDGSIRTWEALRGTQQGEWNLPSGTTTQLAMGPRGRSLAVATSNGAVMLFNPANGVLIAGQNTHDRLGVSAMAVTPNGERMLTAGRDAEAWIWTEQGPQFELVESNEVVQCAAFSSDASLVATGDSEGKVQIFLTDSGDFLAEFSFPRSEAVLAVSFVAQRTFLLALNSQGVLLGHDLATGTTTELAVLSTQPRNRGALNSRLVRLAEFSSDGRNLHMVLRDPETPGLAWTRWNLSPSLSTESSSNQ